MTNGYLEQQVEISGVPAPTTETESSRFMDSFVAAPPAYFLPTAAGTYADAAPDVGLTHDGIGHALVPFDYDADGRLDVFVANANGPPVLYRNESPPERNWLRVRLSDPSSPGNPTGVGATVEVTRTDGSVVRMPVLTSGSYEAQRPAEAHIGLGDGGVQQLTVRWPGQSEAQVVADVATNQVVTITRP